MPRLAIDDGTSAKPLAAIVVDWDQVIGQKEVSDRHSFSGSSCKRCTSDFCWSNRQFFVRRLLSWLRSKVSFQGVFAGYLPAKVLWTRRLGGKFACSDQSCINRAEETLLNEAHL